MFLLLFFYVHLGRNLANPVAMLNASINLLRHLDKPQHAHLISSAIHSTLSALKIHTTDLGGSHTTTELISHIKRHIEENLHKYKNQF